MKSYEGSCWCGDCRYFIEGDPIDTGYCHCKVCQRTCGAPVVVWSTFWRKDFRFLSGNPSTFSTSDRGVRQFCPACGTPLTLRVADEPDTIDVTLSTIQEPHSISPDYHIWCQSRVSWFETSDSLPRYDDEGPDSAHLKPHSSLS